MPPAVTRAEIFKEARGRKYGDYMNTSESGWGRTITVRAMKCARWRAQERLAEAHSATPAPEPSPVTARLVPSTTALTFLTRCSHLAALALLCPFSASAWPGPGAWQTQVVDTTPAPFSFTPVNNATPGIRYVAGPIIVTGITGPSPISVTGGRYRINAGSFTSVAGTVNANDRVRVVVWSSSANGTAAAATLTIGGVSASFTVTTAGSTTDDRVPDSFSFAPVNNAALSATYVSTPATITGITGPSPISVEGGLYKINNGPATAQAGTVNVNDRVSLQVTASSQKGTAVTATVTIGGVRAPFTVTTAGSATDRPRPAEVLNFSNWRLTLPVTSGGGTTGLATTIMPSALVRPPGYTSQYLYTDANGAVVFYAPSNGATSTPGEGSDNTRTELRELYKLSGPTEWTNGVGGTLTASCRVDRTPIARKSVVIGQIHGVSSILLLLTYDEAKRIVQAKFYKGPNSSDGPTVQIASNIGIGDRIDYRIQWIGANISVTVNGRTVNRQTSSSWNGVGVYFKAGTYNAGSANRGNPAGDAGQVAFFNLDLQH
ncbi:MAG: polysaccharide lyase family 7 protein [Nevskia sp.]|nr:polysaccharide lyase family 7 protein [Nevskia sp.]